MKHTVYFVLLALSLLWCAGIILPAVIADSHPLAATSVHLLYRPVCHQRADRSLSVHDHPFSVCERCSAIYFSTMLLVFLYPFRKRLHLPFGISLRTLLIFLLPLLLDRLLAIANLAHNTMETRLLTGVLAGIGIGLFVLPAWMEAGCQYTRTNRISLLHNHGGRT